MPLPQNARITLPKFLPMTPEDGFANNRELDRWAANLPFFVARIDKNQSIGASTLTATSWTDFPTTSPFTIPDFIKYESWTNVIVRGSVQGQINNNHKWEIGVRFTSTATWIAVPVVKEYWLAGQYGASTTIHFRLVGEQLVTDLPAGTYTVTLISRVDTGGSASTDTHDDGFLSIMETP